jgi:hypothetical protein
MLSNGDLGDRSATSSIPRHSQHLDVPTWNTGARQDRASTWIEFERRWRASSRKHQPLCLAFLSVLTRGNVTGLSVRSREFASLLTHSEALMFPNYRHAPIVDPLRKRCPVCNHPVYSPAGIHPQCAVSITDLPRSMKTKPAPSTTETSKDVAVLKPTVGG